MSRLEEAKEILKAFGFDKARTNDRSARTLMALARLDENSSWAEATNTMQGVRNILDWIRDRLGHYVAENTRETYRRQTLHQFRDAGFVIYNHDNPGRVPNSSLNNYRLNPQALKVIQLFGKPEFNTELEQYLTLAPGLVAKYRAARIMTRIPVALPSGVQITLSGGGQNVLIKQMIDDFCGYFVPGAEVLYIGDADEKLMHFDVQTLGSLGVSIDTHGQMPDLVVYQRDKNWLFLMEAASSHGPVDSKRHGELQALFAGSTAGLVYVSCFPDRPTMRKFLAELAWETEAWCASDPTHMIHLNGDRFMGPYTVPN